ncbi:hypothetical protein niasHS_011830 [Heterodera schachtii]|uniref:Uncharacterized protein n=1 Tax=Heterodera schachtii TaxID=97005 RepID=A0ABD2IVT0_HETSC
MSDYDKLKLSPSKLGVLQIRRTKRTKNARIYKQIANGKENWYPLPEDQLPAEITSFQRIEIRYVDSEVIAFLQRIERLLEDCEIVLRVQIVASQRQSWRIFKDKIWPLINKNITAFVTPSTWLPLLQQNIAQTALINFANLRMLEYFNAPPSQEAINWLHNLTTDRRPKAVRCGLLGELVDDFRARFVAASSPTIFIVLLHCMQPIEPFQIDNDVTNERLELQLLTNADPRTTALVHRRLLVRCPVDRNVEQWKQFEQSVLNWDSATHPRLYIQLNDVHLGEDITNEGEGTSNQ